MAKTKSKFFRVAVEGVTTDGREISRDWIQQMAATYNPAKYGARIFAEHIRGMMPDGAFRAFGDVAALKAEEIPDGDLKGKLALYAQIEPSDNMVKLIRSGQKIYTSIEVDASFADSKLAYLTGLGITDSPASLGTEVLAFAAQHPEASPFRARKQKPENLFTAAQETSIELDEATSQDDPEAAESRFFAKLQGLLEKFAGKQPAPAEPNPKEVKITTDPRAEFAELAIALRDGLTELAKQHSQSAADIKAMREAVDAHKKTVDAELAKFREDLDTTPSGAPTRPAATGGNGTVATDC